MARPCTLQEIAASFLTLSGSSRFSILVAMSRVTACKEDRITRLTVRVAKAIKHFVMAASHRLVVTFCYSLKCD